MLAFEQLFTSFKAHCSIEKVFEQNENCQKKNVLGVATQLEEKKILICFPQSFNCVQVKFLITPNTLKRRHCTVWPNANRLNII